MAQAETYMTFSMIAQGQDTGRFDVVVSTYSLRPSTAPAEPPRAGEKEPFMGRHVVGDGYVAAGNVLIGERVVVHGQNLRLRCPLFKDSRMFNSRRVAGRFAVIRNEN